jgi:hypothetical protein
MCTEYALLGIAGEPVLSCGYSNRITYEYNPKPLNFQDLSEIAPKTEKKKKKTTPGNQD